MYSPPTGRAACRSSATIDKQQTSDRRFIIAARRTIYAQHEIPQVVGRDRRARRVFVNAPGRAVSNTFPTSLPPLLRAQGLPTFGVFESARTYRHEQAPLPEAD